MKIILVTLAVVGILSAGDVRAAALTFECELNRIIYYVRIGEPSFLNRFRNTDLSAVNVELRYYLDGEFGPVSVNKSDENGINATINPAPRGAPEEATFTIIRLSRTGVGTMLMSHYKAVPTGTSGGGKHKYTIYENQQLGPHQLFICSKHQPLF